MDNQSKQANQPSEVQTPRPTKLRWVIASVVLLAVVMVLVWMLQQGGYLQTRALFDIRSDEDVLFDEFTAWEARCAAEGGEDCVGYPADISVEEYCTGVKEARIAGCDYLFQQGGSDCKTDKADSAYNLCLAETTQEDLDDIRLFDYENYARSYVPYDALPE